MRSGSKRRRKKVSCIIPAYNEELTIDKVISTARKSRQIDEIIVVDDGSTDGTAAIAQGRHTILLRHSRNRGKGAAIKTGAENAKGDVLLFIDADFKNITPKKIEKILLPILEKGTDFVKTTFKRERGRVTKFVARPLLKLVFPEASFKQPLSGQTAIKKSLFEKMDLTDSWGIEAQMLIQAVRRKARVCEVSIGNLKHKAQSEENLSEMSAEIMSTVLSELGHIYKKHRAIFFDFDKTLIKASSIEVFAEEWGFTEELKRLRRKLAKGIIEDRDITIELAKHFKGKTQGDVEKVCKKIKITKNAKLVIAELRRKMYRVRIISSAFSPVVGYFARELNVYDFYCPKLKMNKRGTFTGELKKTRFSGSGCCGQYMCKRKVANYFRKIRGLKKSECVAIADGKNDRCLFSAVGLALAFKPEKKIGDKRISNLAEVVLCAE